MGRTLVVCFGIVFHNCGVCARVCHGPALDATGRVVFGTLLFGLVCNRTCVLDGSVVGFVGKQRLASLRLRHGVEWNIPGRAKV